MPRTRRAISLLVAAMVTHAVSPAAAQTGDVNLAPSGYNLSPALDEAWLDLSDTSEPDARRDPSLVQRHRWGLRPVLYDERDVPHPWSGLGGDRCREGAR